MPEEEAAATAPAEEEKATAKASKENGDAGDASKAADGEAAPKEGDDLENVQKCDKPNKEEFDRKTTQLNDEIAVLNNKLTSIDDSIKKTKAQGGGQMDDLTQARAQMKTLRDQKDKIMRERQEVLDKRNAAKESLDKKMNAGRALRAELKFSSLDEIEKQITDLEYRQQMTSMSLAAEKKLLKEIDTLKQSKKAVAQLSQHQESVSTERDAQKSINEQLTEKSKELDAVKKQIEDQRVVLEGLNSENSDRKSALPSLFKEKDAIRAEKTAKVEEIKALRNDFRKAENDFRNYLRKVRQQRAEERKAEEDARKLEQDARKKAWEEEEAKKVPYEEEMALCDYLVNYLTTSFLEKTDGETAAAAKKEAGDGPVTEFEGFKLVGKAARAKFDETDDFCNLGLGKKKGRGKKVGGPKKSDKLVLAVDTFEHFSMVGVDAPTTREACAAACDALKARKTYFSTLPRGEIPSIREKQLAESEKRSKAEREERRRERDGDDPRPDRPPRRDADAPKPKEEKPKPKKEKAEFNALEMGGNDALFPGLPPAPKPAASGDSES